MGAVVKSQEKIAQEILENYVKEYKIFIDTCSLLNPNVDNFWTNVIPYLEKYQTKIIIPRRCIEEIEKHARKKDNPEMVENAKRCIKRINQLQNGKYIEIRGEESDNFADNVFLVVFTKFRMKYKLLLITEDNNLSKDIINLNNSHSVQANHIWVKRINKYGFLSDSGWYEQQKTEKKKNDQVKNIIKKDEIEIDENEKFRICDKVTGFPEDKLTITYMPKEGDIVHSSNGNVKLMKKLGAGGEASVYATDKEYVAKVYKEEKITIRQYKKMKTMLSKDINCPGVCYPVDILYNAYGEFIGFLMPKAKGIELQKSVFAPKETFQKKFPGWKKRDTVELCITILNKIKYLHDRNIIMGDINPSNILVVSSTEVYFVDTDSYQIEDFPCPVGTINYTAPEIQKKHYGDFLRTMGHENFAVATLLFMIMLPGKPPYSQQGGEDPVSNIIKMDFSYPFGDNSNKKTPLGLWRYVWSHLTYDLKASFYKTFRKNEEYSTEKTRLSVGEWITIFQEFQELLDSGIYGQQDKMSEELFPTRLKKNPKSKYVKCKLCLQETDETQCIGGICRECLDKGEVYICRDCKKEILFSNYDKYIKKAKRRVMCPSCYENGNRIYTRQYCRDCGIGFDITNRQYKSYIDKGYDLPKSCPACRGKRTSGGYSSTYSTCYTPLHYYPYRNSSLIQPRVSSNAGNRNISATKIPKTINRKVSEPQSELEQRINEILAQTKFVSYDEYYAEREQKKQKPYWESSQYSGCFITTAVCEYFGKEDDCEELTILRHYRDTWLKAQKDGEELIKEYYQCAPHIVDVMKQSVRYGEYCEVLLSEYIQPCIALIHQGKYQQCKERYIEMVHYAKELTE